MSSPKVPAADQTLRILSLLARARGPVPAAMIATKLELPRSTVYQLLQAMQEHGYVMHLAEERRYGLGIAAVELSSAYERHQPIAHLGRPLLASLVDRVGASGHLAVPSGSDVLYVLEERVQGGPRLVTDVDVRLPMHLTASGLAILECMPRPQVRAIYPNAQAFAHRLDTQRGPTKYSELRAALDDVATRGFALERGSVSEGFSSVASAVIDHRGWPVAAVALTFSDEKVAPDSYEAMARETRAVADALSERIHGRGRGQ